MTKIEPISRHDLHELTMRWHQGNRAHGRYDEAVAAVVAALIPVGYVVVSADDVRAALGIIERHTDPETEPSPLTDRLRAAVQR